MRVDERGAIAVCALVVPVVASLVAQKILKRSYWHWGVGGGALASSAALLSGSSAPSQPGPPQPQSYPAIIEDPVRVTFEPDDSWREFRVTKLGVPIPGWKCAIVGWIGIADLEKFLSAFKGQEQHLKQLIVVVGSREEADQARALVPQCELAFKGQYIDELSDLPWVNQTGIDVQVKQARTITIQVGGQEFEVSRKVLRARAPSLSADALQQSMFELKDDDALRTIFGADADRRIDLQPRAFQHLYALLNGGEWGDYTTEELEVMAGMAQTFGAAELKDELLAQYAPHVPIMELSYFLPLAPPKRAMDVILNRVAALSDEEAITLAQLGASNGSGEFIPLAEAAFDRIISFGQNKPWTDDEWKRTHGRLHSVIQKFHSCNTKWNNANLPIQT